MNALILKSEISLILSENFTGVKIYKDPVLQNMVKPCFLINLIDASCTAIAPSRFGNINSFNISYITADNQTQLETTLLSIGSALLPLLEKLTIETITTTGETQVKDKIIKSTNMSLNIVDNVLHFIVDYSYQTKYPIFSDIKMNELTQNIGVM
jgi:hypothetical protein